MDNLNPIGIIKTHVVRLFWKVRFRMHGCKYYPMAGGQEPTLETQATTITDLEGQITTLREAGSKSFYGSLSEEVRSNPSMLKFERSSNEDIAKSYINLQSKISAKGLTIPGKNASKEEMAGFWKELGRPDTADGYQITLPENLHEGIVSNAESQKVFKGKCHEIGLSGEQTQLLHSWYMTELSNVLKLQDEDDTKVVNEAKTALSARWGTTYEPKLALATKVIDKFGGEKVFELFKGGLGANPLVLEMMAKIGDVLSEDVLGPGGHSQYGGLTPDAAQAKVTAILADSKHAYHNAGTGHKEAVEEMLLLNQIITATPKNQ